MKKNQASIGWIAVFCAAFSVAGCSHRQEKETKETEAAEASAPAEIQDQEWKTGKGAEGLKEIFYAGGRSC